MELRPQVGIDCQKRSRSGLHSKRPDMRSVSDISKVNVNKVNILFIDYTSCSFRRTLSL